MSNLPRAVALLAVVGMALLALNRVEFADAAACAAPAALADLTTFQADFKRKVDDFDSRFGSKPAPDQKETEEMLDAYSDYWTHSDKLKSLNPTEQTDCKTEIDSFNIAPTPASAGKDTVPELKTRLDDLLKKANPPVNPPNSVADVTTAKAALNSGGGSPGGGGGGSTPPGGTPPNPRSGATPPNRGLNGGGAMVRNANGQMVMANGMMNGMMGQNGAMTSPYGGLLNSVSHNFFLSQAHMSCILGGYGFGGYNPYGLGGLYNPTSTYPAYFGAASTTGIPGLTGLGTGTTTTNGLNGPNLTSIRPGQTTTPTTTNPLTNQTATTAAQQAAANAVAQQQRQNQQQPYLDEPPLRSRSSSSSYPSIRRTYTVRPRRPSSSGARRVSHTVRMRLHDLKVKIRELRDNISRGSRRVRAALRKQERVLYSRYKRILASARRG